MIAAILAALVCLPLTVDAVDGSVARIETRCGIVHVTAPAWAREGMTTAPWMRERMRRLRESLPVAPEGDLEI